MQGVTHEAMRGPSAWSVGDRELMAAFIAKTNECEWCTKAHVAVAEGAYRGGAKVSAALSDLETAAIEEPLRATLRMLRKLTREHVVDADDMGALLAAGVSRAQIEDALRSASLSTRSVASPTPLGSSCRVPRPSRPVRNTCWRVATADYGRFTGVDRSAAY
jgi:AhpD family alkylhydroperoxidase